MLSLPLVSPFPLGPSLGQGSLLCPGGRLSRPLRPGGRLTCQSHLTPPLTCQSHLTPPLTCQSHLTPPLTCQSHLTPPLTCQSLVTPQQFTQCHFTSLRSLLPRPGGLLSHWPHMDLALRSLPRFHLRSTALLDCAGCVWSVWKPLFGGGGLCHESGCHSLQLHITHGLHLPSCTAHTHSRPPLHQSHSCHHSLISLDCLPTPAPHSHSHMQHTYTHPVQSLVFPWLTFPSGFPSLSSRVLPGLLTPSPDRLLPASLTLPAFW